MNYQNIDPSLVDLTVVRERVQKQIIQPVKNEQKIFDVIVLGVGSMGSSTCYHLAKQGVKVLGLEQFEIPNEFSSHTGQSRIIRKAYFEHPDYVPLLERAYQKWEELESMTGKQVYFKTGLLYFARPDHVLMKGVLLSADRFNIRLDTLSSKDVHTRYPHLKIPNDHGKLFEPEAGFITPERAILLYTDLALQKGAIIKANVKVAQWNKSADGIEVITTDGVYFAKKIIITAGPWAGKMIGKLSSSLRVTRQIIAWVHPNNISLFELGNWPCWMIADEAKPGLFYGFPALPSGNFDGPAGFKLAHHFPGSLTDPDHVDRTPTAEDEANLVDMLNKFFPGEYKATELMKTCLYTNTPDENFILDFLPGYEKDVVLAAGFSGHGFKFASVVGEIMSDLALTGNTELATGFLNANRFEKEYK